MTGDKLNWIEFRIGTGTIQQSFSGQRDFYPDSPIENWPWFRVVGKSKNISIDELIAKLNSLKDTESD